MDTVNLKALFKSPIFWGVVGGVLLLFVLSWGFVWMKTKDCQLLCGEAAGESAKYWIGGGSNGRPSLPMGAGCDCGNGNRFRALGFGFKESLELSTAFNRVAIL